MDLNFLPNVQCPHCKKITIVAISGFGGELNIREKVCRHCEKTFTLIVHTSTTIEKEIDDLQLASIRERIKWLKEQRKKTYAERLIAREFAEKLNEEAMEIAREMRRKRSIN
jgi:hypothetical protein